MRKENFLKVDATLKRELKAACEKNGLFGVINKMNDILDPEDNWVVEFKPIHEALTIFDGVNHYIDIKSFAFRNTDDLDESLTIHAEHIERESCDIERQPDSQYLISELIEEIKCGKAQISFN